MVIMFYQIKSLFLFKFIDEIKMSYTTASLIKNVVVFVIAGVGNLPVDVVRSKIFH